MMRTLSTFLGTAAILMGLAGCVDSPEDLLSTVTSATLTQTTTDPMGTETGDPTATGDGDGDASGDGDGDPASGDGDGDASCGSFNAPCCEGDVCDEGLSCDGGTCQLGPDTGDGDGDPTTTGGPAMWGDGPYYGDPVGGCQPDEIPLADGQLPVAGGHCSAPAMCADANCMNADACPPAPEGTEAQGGTAWATMEGDLFCALICQFGADPDQCPAGSTCKDLMQMGLGVCTYP